MRVIGGTLRGRELRAPKGAQTRPTKDNVREAWFNILGNVTDARVLEVYAGTGALGIEAMSRGARSAVFVESWSGAQKVLAQNLERLDLANLCTVVGAPVERSLKRLVGLGPFDLILADPPWTNLRRCLDHLSRVLQSDLLAEQALIYVGHPSNEVFEPPARSGLALVDRRAWGDSGASLFRWSPVEGEDLAGS